MDGHYGQQWKLIEDMLAMNTMASSDTPTNSIDIQVQVLNSTPSNSRSCPAQ